MKRTAGCIERESERAREAKYALRSQSGTEIRTVMMFVCRRLRKGQWRYCAVEDMHYFLSLVPNLSDILGMLAKTGA